MEQCQVNFSTQRPRLCAANRFGAFRPEVEREVRVVEVKPNHALDAMKKAWKKCSFYYRGYISPEDELRGNDHLMPFIANSRYTAKDIEEFCIMLCEFQGEVNFSYKAGLFLSALMCGSQEAEFVIHTSHLYEPIHLLGRYNSKKIVVNGDISSDLGMMMRGTIIVNGNAGDAVGNSMKGGSIIVEGNAGREVGASMGGGAIIVKGNVLDYAGDMMEGGEITVKGHAGEGFGSRMGGGIMVLEGNAGDKVGYLTSGGIINVYGTAGKGVGDLMDKGEVHIYGNRPVISKEFTAGKIFHGDKLVLRKRKPRNTGNSM